MFRVEWQRIGKSEPVTMFCRTMADAMVEFKLRRNDTDLVYIMLVDDKGETYWG